MYIYMYMYIIYIYIKYLQSLNFKILCMLSKFLHAGLAAARLRHGRQKKLSSQAQKQIPHCAGKTLQVEL